jgi:sRNA-binding regulator protein Hfq
MAETRFIRIGAPSGDGPPEVVAPRAPEAPAPRPVEAPPPAAVPSVLPPEVFGAWAEEVPAPNPQPPVANGHGGGAPVARPRPEPLRTGPVAPSPTLLRHGGPAHEPPSRGGRISHEDERLNEMRRSGRPVEAVCFEGLRITGRLVAFDQYALILEVDGGEAVLFKHGVIMLRYAD